MTTTHSTGRSDWKATPEYGQGKTGERAIAELFKARGWYVIPSYDYVSDEEKAPQMHGMYRGLILPDLDICRDGERRWIEVKTYTAPSFYRKTQEWQHGIQQRHWEHYREVEAISGTPVWIYVYQLNDGAVLAQEQHLLSGYAEMRTDKRNHVQYYFPVSRMRIAHRFPLVAVQCK